MSDYMANKADEQIEGSAEQDVREFLKSPAGKAIAARLVGARSRAGLSIQTLAEKSGVSMQLILGIELNERMMTPRQARELGRVLNVTPQYMIAGE